MAKLKITLVRSLIGRPGGERDTAQALGLKKTGGSVIREDTPPIRGMIRKLSHLLKVEEM